MRGKTDHKYFRALSDVLLNSIKRKDFTIIDTLSRFFYGAFKDVRDASKGQPVVYPAAYYEVVYRIIEELASQPNLTNPPIEYRTSGSVWLLGEGTDAEISSETFNWIWRNFMTAVRYDKDEFILNHWQTAHQYLTFSLRHLHPTYDRTSTERTPTNEKQINDRRSLRGRFIEFHYALGGLILYKQRYRLIKQLFDYTTSIPPRYELLPESMNEIFHAYNVMRDPYDRKYPFIEHVFPFPEMSGLNSGNVIKMWISSYMALLFLRQYTIYPYLITMQPLAYPQPPKTQGELRQWIENLPFFKKLVSQHLENKKLLEVTSLDFITREWCETNKVAYPLDFIDSLKTNFEGIYEKNSKNLPLLNSKVDRFIDVSKSIVENAILSYKAIQNSGNLGDDPAKWYVEGRRMVQGKDAFSENPEADHLNFDTILGSLMKDEIHERIASTFMYQTSKTFVLKPENIFKAIDLIGTDSHIVIGFGVDLTNYISELEITTLTSKIVRYEGARIIEPSFFIIRKEDLPVITTLPIDDAIVKKYDFKKISDTLNLYASLIDLNKASEGLILELKEENGENDLKKSVLLTIGLRLQIEWRKEMRLVQLVEYSEYRQSGLPNTLADIKQFLS